MLRDSDAWIDALSNCLRKVPFFTDLSPIKFARVVHCFELRQFEHGTVVFREGSVANGLFMIMRGHIILSSNVLPKYPNLPFKILSPGTLLNLDHIT